MDGPILTIVFSSSDQYLFGFSLLGKLKVWET